MKSRLILSAVAIAAAFSLAPRTDAASKQYLAYIGTYTGTQSKGIYAFRFDPGSGKLDPLGLAGELARPSFLAIHPNRKYLYAVSELDNSSVTAFEIDTKSGNLKLLNTVPTKGSAACHLVLTRPERPLWSRITATAVSHSSMWAPTGG